MTDTKQVLNTEWIRCVDYTLDDLESVVEHLDKTGISNQEKKNIKSSLKKIIKSTKSLRTTEKTGGERFKIVNELAREIILLKGTFLKINFHSERDKVYENLIKGEVELETLRNFAKELIGISL